MLKGEGTSQTNGPSPKRETEMDGSGGSLLSLYFSHSSPVCVFPTFSTQEHNLVLKSQEVGRCANFS